MMIRFLYGAARTNRHLRIEMMYRFDAFRQLLERARNASNGVVNPRRAVERDDNVINAFGDGLGLRFEEQSGRQKGNSACRRSKHLRQPTPLFIQLWLASREDNPAHA